MRLSEADAREIHAARICLEAMQFRVARLAQELRVQADLAQRLLGDIANIDEPVGEDLLYIDRAGEEITDALGMAANEIEDVAHDYCEAHRDLRAALSEPTHLEVVRD